LAGAAARSVHLMGVKPSTELTIVDASAVIFPAVRELVE
jgi:hypothetical protein